MGGDRDTGQDAGSRRGVQENLLEAIADQDEELMVMYLEGEEIEPDQIRAAIRKATLEIEMTPSSSGRRSRTRASSRCLTVSWTTCRAR